MLGKPITLMYLGVDAFQGFTRAMLHFMLAAMDSWSSSIKVKRTALALFLISLTYKYYSQRKRVWITHHEIETPSGRDTLKDIFLGAVFSEWLFAIKLLVPYCCGHQYAVLKRRIMDPGKYDTDQHYKTSAQYQVTLEHRNTEELVRAVPNEPPGRPPLTTSPRLIKFGECAEHCRLSDQLQTQHQGLSRESDVLSEGLQNTAELGTSSNCMAVKPGQEMNEAVNCAVSQQKDH